MATAISLIFSSLQPGHSRDPSILRKRPKILEKLFVQLGKLHQSAQTQRSATVKVVKLNVHVEVDRFDCSIVVLQMHGRRLVDTFMMTIISMLSG